MQEILDKIFLAYDVRGKVGDELNVGIVKKIGKSLAEWLPNDGPVVVGKDMRSDSAELASALIDGLKEQGRDVVDIGQVTSDMLYFAVGSLDYAGGAMITASHNPGEYNGIKFCREKAQAIGIETGLLEIKQSILDDSFKKTDTAGTVRNLDITNEWISHALSFIDVNKLLPLKVAVDAGNGMAGAIFPTLEEHVPFSVKQMYFELDGTFPNHIANPLEPKNLVDLQNEMKANSYDAGIAFDGDGDRAVLIDENGEALTGTVLTALLTEYFAKENPGEKILLNAICGKAAHDAVNANDCKVVKTKVGHSYIKNDMRKHNAIFAGEHSGHYYFKDNFSADSGLIAAVIALYLLSVFGKKLSELAAPYREAYYQIPETNFEVDNKQEIIDALKMSYSDFPQDLIDGVTVQLDNGWFNVRPSNTEPLLRLNAEASTQDDLVKIVSNVEKVIKG